jgi:hypothetical protein
MVDALVQQMADTEEDDVYLVMHDSHRPDIVPLRATL